MHVDDRLATVLHVAVDGDVARRIQYRQLVDLLGTSPADARGKVHDAAHLRLAELGQLIGHEERARAIAQSGIRLRNPRLVATLASDHPAVALAAIRAARLDEGQWLDLIPAMPLAARHLLRMRSDLAPAVEARLEQLGINDRALPAVPEAEPVASVAEPVSPLPTAAPAAPAAAPPSRLSRTPPTAPAEPTGEGIAAIVRRIESFRRSREQATAAHPEAPRLPLGEVETPAAPLGAFSFATDAAGRIGWAEGAAAPMVCGLLLPALDEGDGGSDSQLARLVRHRQPIRAALVALEGAPAVTGEWQLDAAPEFDDEGHFTGYAGRFRRPPPAVETVRNPEADRVRQILHELRTPVNAIQGFAEVIQQQLFGSTPHEYRALAASIAADAARMLAGFEELDRFARCDSGALAPEPGKSDLAMVVAGVVHQLEAFTSARSSGFSLEAAPGDLPVGIAHEEAERMVWRILATLAGAARPGEILGLHLAGESTAIRLVADLPEGLASLEDVFAPSPALAGQAVNAGVFGNGFTLRLAGAEARAAGGSLVREGDSLVLDLPALRNGEFADLQNTDSPVASAAE